VSDLSQFERELTKERIAAGLQAAKARGRKLGRRTVRDHEREAAVREILAVVMNTRVRQLCARNAAHVESP